MPHIWQGRVAFAEALPLSGLQASEAEPAAAVATLQPQPVLGQVRACCKPEACSAGAEPLTSAALQAQLLALGVDLLSTHVLPHCSLKDLAALGSTCQGLRLLVADLPEPIWRARAQRCYPPTHPVCVSSNLRAALVLQQRLQAGLATPGAWTEHEGVAQPPDCLCKALSPDLKLVALARGAAIDVVERATHALVATLKLATGSTQHNCAFSWDSSTLAVASPALDGQQACCSVTLLALASKAQTCVRLTSPEHHIGPPVWAPSAGVLCVAVYPSEDHGETCMPELVLLSASGDILARVVAPVTTFSAEWCPGSQLLAFSSHLAMHCLQWRAATWHAFSGIQPFSAWDWVPRGTHLPQLLVIGWGQALQLLQAPALTRLSSQQVALSAACCKCTTNAVAVIDVQSHSLWLFHLQCAPAAGQPFLQVLCSLPHPAGAAGPAFSPAGSCFARAVPDVSGIARLEIVRFAAPSALTIATRLISSSAYPNWSANACSIAFPSLRLQDLCIVHLLGD